MAINLLTEIYQKRGDEFIQKLLSLKVYIYEKMAGSAFSFEYKNGSFIFYKKNTNISISNIDRLLMKHYEAGINYIENLPADVVQNIPAKTRFGFEYFPTEKPNYLKYDNLPKNFLILSYVKNLGDSSFEENHTKMEQYATLLDVTPPPVIFDGILSEEQQVEIMDYVRMTPTEIQEKFKTSSFTKFIISMLNPDMKKTVLNDDIESSIDGVIFQFENDSKKIFAKAQDPIISEVVSSNTSKPGSSILTSMIFGDMIEYMELQRQFWKDFKFKKVDIDDRYIELMSEVFNKFIAQNKNKYDGVELDIPDFMRGDSFSLNMDYLDNPKTIELVSTEETSRELFKMLVALFRKKRKSVSDNINPNLVKYQKELVDEITTKLQEGGGTGVETFEKFMNWFVEEKDFPINASENLDGIEFNGTTEFIGPIQEEEECEVCQMSVEEKMLVLLEQIEASGSNVEPELFTALTTLQEQLVGEKKACLIGHTPPINESKSYEVLNFWQTAFEAEPPKEKPKKDEKLFEVNVMVGKFQPFNNKHLQALKELNAANNKKTIVVQINPNKKSDRKPFNESLSFKMLDKLGKDHGDLIEGFYITQKASMKNVLDRVDKRYTPVMISSNESYQSYLKKQLEYNLFEEDYDLDEPLEFHNFSKGQLKSVKSNSEKIMKSLKENDIREYKKNVPKSLHVFFEKFRNEVKDD